MEALRQNDSRYAIVTYVPRDGDDRVFTPDEAQYCLDVYAYPNQRPVRSDRTATYARSMRAGRFGGYTVLKFVRLHGRYYLVDGQHRLRALIMTAMSIGFRVVVIDVRQLSELQDIYANEDNNLTRQNADVMKGYGLIDELQLNRTDLAQLCAASRAIMAGFTTMYVQPSRSLMRDWVVEWTPEAHEYFAAIQGSPLPQSSRMRKASIMGIALLTYRYARAQADTFWGPMAHDDGLRANDPRKALLRWVVSNPTMAGGVSARICAHYVALAWRAHYKGRTLVKLQLNSPDSPIIICGTPYASDVATQKLPAICALVG